MTERPIWFCSRFTIPILAAGLLLYYALTWAVFTFGGVG